MKRLLLVGLCLTMVLAMSLAAAGAEVIKVASEMAYPPFEQLDPDGKMWGFDIELVTAIVEEMGAEIQLLNVGWDGLIPGIQYGSFDLLISAMTITPERAEQIDFSDWYFDSRQAVLVRQNDNRIKTKTDLAGKRIGVQLGTTGDFAVSELDYVDADKDVRRFETSPEAIMELMTGGVDAAVIDMPVALYYRDRYPGFKLVVDPSEWEPEYYGIGVKKGRTDLLERVNAALKALRESGKYQEIYDKYFGL
ncbi:MAG: basic amino acid ABC transporter substrate-binding protein [Firmicutes bacterium]|jgi:lysine-arginine-ornithine-binding protein|nr:basic amino acid ABC transporter substrate-binding protein [Bacillota bacterium]